MLSYRTLLVNPNPFLKIMRNKKLKTSMIKSWIVRTPEGRERLNRKYETYADELKRTQRENIEK